MAAAFRRMDQARERSRRNVVAYLKAGACPACLLQNNPERSGSSWWMLQFTCASAPHEELGVMAIEDINHGRGRAVFGSPRGYWVRCAVCVPDLDSAYLGRRASSGALDIVGGCPLRSSPRRHQILKA